jgi:hypothetical protein
MRKLTAAGMIAAGALGFALQANAAALTYNITGNLSPVDNSCTQIVFLLGGGDCSYAFGRGAPNVWYGPSANGSYYTVGSVGDSVDAAPPGTPTYAAPITGTITVDDNGTPTGSDDTISGAVIVGAAARAAATGQSTRGVERWDTLTWTFPATAVFSGVDNAEGGKDYVVGSKGFPVPICNLANASDCFPSPNAYTGLGPLDPDTGDLVPFWSGPDPAGVGIESSVLLDPPSGNIGAAPTVTFTNYSCAAKNTVTSAPDPAVCDEATNTANNDVLLGKAPNTWGNLILQISTNSSGQITAAKSYWTKPYYIRFPPGSPATGENNSWNGGAFTFIGSSRPLANDDNEEVIQDSSNNVFDVLANDGDFGPSAVVTIITPVSHGTANVVDNEVVYTPTPGYTGPDSLVYEVTDGGANTDDATVTITVAPDTVPVAPNGTLTLNTQGVSPASVLGSLNLSTLPGFSGGNGPSVIAIVTQGIKGAAAAPTTGTTVNYTPQATFFSGQDTFTYKITDAQGDVSPTDGIITVNIPLLNPAITGGSITTDQDTTSSPLALAVTAGNGSGAQHTLSVSVQGTSGTCALSGTTAASPVTVTYTPAPDFFGTDSCTVTIEDGDGSEGTATINVTVDEVSNDIRLPGGGSAVDGFSLAFLAGLPLLRRRRR